MAAWEAWLKSMLGCFGEWAYRVLLERRFGERPYRGAVRPVLQRAPVQGGLLVAPSLLSRRVMPWRYSGFSRVAPSNHREAKQGRGSWLIPNRLCRVGRRTDQNVRSLAEPPPVQSLMYGRSLNRRLPMSLRLTTIPALATLQCPN